jgi:hypothetical protein
MTILEKLDYPDFFDETFRHLTLSRMRFSVACTHAHARTHTELITRIQCTHTPHPTPKLRLSHSCTLCVSCFRLGYLFDRQSHQAYSHQVKSVTMSNWTMEEVDALRVRTSGQVVTCHVVIPYLCVLHLDCSTKMGVGTKMSESRGMGGGKPLCQPLEGQ